ncbi:hypothetical protein [Streptomyces sp. NBC_00286]|uniref:hypothetical protein n=1 Tax=Streptomyces sp. NBC_00286 TaxID=2975701 RepID=UPI002E295232|nr:hypothetical protein [Streptomyces sp. NBC_00286]
MTTPGFHPTHVVPRDGMPAWDAPDPARPTVPLDALLPVRLVDRRGDWGHIVCANGWSAWVDGRLLIAVPQEPPAAAHPLARTADPRPLLTRVEQAVGRYRQAVEDLTAGRLNGETFHARTQGLRIGIVADGESVWLYEAEHERWVYCDGTHLTTYATPAPPATERGEPGASAGRESLPPAGPERPASGAAEPTRVVDARGASGAKPPRGVGEAGVGSDGDPTRVVADANGAATAEPTQVVDATDGVAGPEPTWVVDAPEPTRVVDARASGVEQTPGVGEAGVGSDGDPTRVVADANGAATAEPTQVVDATDGVAGPEPTWVVDAPEPTRVVDARASGVEQTPGVGEAGVGSDGDPTRVVADANGAATAEPTQVVDATDGVAGPEPTRVVDAPEPTRVVDARASGVEQTPGVGEAGVGSDGDPTRVVADASGAATAEPTQVVDATDGVAGPEPTRVVDAPEPTQLVPDREDTRVVGDREETRVVDDPEAPQAVVDRKASPEAADPDATQAIGDPRHAPTRIVTSDGEP